MIENEEDPEERVYETDHDDTDDWNFVEKKAKAPHIKEMTWEEWEKATIGKKVTDPEPPRKGDLRIHVTT